MRLNGNPSPPYSPNIAILEIRDLVVRAMEL
jgi:hypothetical protein